MQPGYVPPEEEPFELEDDVSDIELTNQSSSSTGYKDDYFEDVWESCEPAAPVRSIDRILAALATFESMMDEAEMGMSTPPILPSENLTEESLDLVDDIVVFDPTYQSGIVPTGSEEVFEEVWACCDPATPVISRSPVLKALKTLDVVIPDVENERLEVVPPMREDFNDLSSALIAVDGSAVVSWDVPSLESQVLTPSECTFAHEDSTAISQGAPDVVSGWRPIIPGEEVYQFVAFNAAGASQAFLWWEEKIRKVKASSSAVYVCQNYDTPTEEFVISSGSPATDINWVPHDWQAFNLEVAIRWEEFIGVSLLMNAMEYRVYKQKTFHLLISAYKRFDYDRNEYEVFGVGSTPQHRVAEVRWLKTNVCEFIRWSRRKRPDTARYIQRVKESMTLADIQQRVIPVYPFQSVYPLMKYGNLPYQPCASHLERRGLTPFSIGDSGSMLDFPSVILTEQRRIFSLDALLLAYSPPNLGPVRCLYLRHWVLTPVPIIHTTRVFVSRMDICDPKVLAFFPNSVHDIRGERFLIFYGSRQSSPPSALPLPESTNYLHASLRSYNLY